MKASKSYNAAAPNTWEFNYCNPSKNHYTRLRNEMLQRADEPREKIRNSQWATIRNNTQGE
jgi:hypothetical protein